MTISSEISKAGPFYGNGSNTTFPYGFKIFDEDHIRVVLISVSGDVSDLSLVDGDYSVSGIGDEVGGNVLKSTPLLVGQVLSLVRRVPLTQETSLENQGAYYPEVVEQRFDLLTMQIQTVNEAVGRSLTVEPGQDKPSMTQIAASEGYAQAAQQSRNEASGFAEDSERSALASAGSATDSGNSATLAQRWANEPENTPVAGGLYSAFHWAMKAASYVASAVQTALAAATLKSAPVDADRFNFLDSAAGLTIKYMTWANLKSALKVYFDPLSGPQLQGYAFGLGLSTNATDAANDIDIAVGAAASDTSPYYLMQLTAPLTKRLDANWAVGNNQGCLDTGAVAASGTYYYFEIQRSDTLVTDILASLSATAPIMPTNYDRKRLIGRTIRSASVNGPPIAVGAPQNVYQADMQLVANPTDMIFTHGLGGFPTEIDIFLVARNAVGGYSVGDTVKVEFQETNNGGTEGLFVKINSTTITVRIGSALRLLNFTTNTVFGATPSDWNIRVRAKS